MNTDEMNPTANTLDNSDLNMRMNPTNQYDSLLSSRERSLSTGNLTNLADPYFTQMLPPTLIPPLIHNNRNIQMNNNLNPNMQSNYLNRMFVLIL